MMKAVPQRLRWLSQSMSFGLLGKSVGFLVPIIIAAKYGVNRDTDSFFLAFTIAALLVAVWNQSLEQFAVPIFAEAKSRFEITQRFQWLQKRVIIGSTATLCVAGGGLALYLFLWSSPSFRNQTFFLYLLLAPQVTSSGLGATYSAYLISRKEYRWPAGTIGLRGLSVVLLVLAAGGYAGVAALSLGYTLGEIARTFLLRAVCRRKLPAQQLSAEHAVSEPDRSTLVRGIYQLGSMGLAGVAPVVERSFAVSLGVGAVTRLDYASKLFYMPSVIFDTNFVAVFLSDWSGLVAERKWRQLTRDIRKAFVVVGFISAVIAATTIVLRVPIVSIVLARGSFPQSEVGVVANLLGVLMLALPFSATSMLGSAACVALGANRLVFRLGLVKMVVRSVGAVALGTAFGLTGVAVAFVVMHVVELAVLLFVTPIVIKKRSGQQ